MDMVLGYRDLLPELKYYNYSSMDLYNAFLGRVQIKFLISYFNVITARCDTIKNLNKNQTCSHLPRQNRVRAGHRI